MEKITLKLNSDSSRSNVLHRIALVAADYDNPVEVTIKPWRRNRSQEQNALYWKWVAIMADEYGNTKDDLHEILKRNHLAPILEREDEGYASMMQALRELWKSGARSKAEALLKQVTRLTSTTGLKVKEMTEYLEAIEQQAADAGIELPKPEGKRL